MSMTVDIDARLFVARNGQFKNSFRENMLKWMNLGREWHAFNAFTFTFPSSGVGGKKWPIDNLKERIADDIKFAYVNPEEDPDTQWPYRVYKLIEQERGKDVADRWYSQDWIPEKFGKNVDVRIDPVSGDPVVSGGTAAEAAFRILRGKISYDEKKYEAYRNKHTSRNHPMRIRGGAPPLGMLNASRRRNVIKSRQRRAGLGKASWRESVRGSKVRATKGADTRMRIVWPREAGTPLRAFKGRKAGSSKLSQAGFKTHYRISSHVPYVEDIIVNEGYIHRTTKNRMNHYFRQRAKALARQSNRVKTLNEANKQLKAA